MRHGKGQVLDVMSDPRQCLEARLSSEGTWSEGQADPGEERFGGELAALGCHES